MTAETSSSYSRENITNSENREKAVQEMRAEKWHVKADQAKTPEQKQTLSEKWLKKAGLSDAGGKAEIMKLLGNPDPKKPEEFVAAVEAYQEKHGLKKDGILWWATLEKMDNEITQWQDEYYVNKPDESWLERSEARATKVAEKNQQLTKLKEWAESTDTALNSSAANVTDPDGKKLVYNADTKQWEGNESDTQGKILNLETGEYESQKAIDDAIAKLKDPTSTEYKAKMREIGEEMKSNPDVYSDTETGKSTYTFNDEELSLEWEAPNQYITRTVNGKKQMWESESESWEDINETKHDTQRIADISSIDGTPLPENSWTKIGKSIYFRNWENLIAIAPGGKLREEVNGTWQDIKDFSQLPKNIREAAANERLQYFQKNYWDWKEGEFWSGTTANFQDIPLSQYNRFDESGNEQSRLEGRILRDMVEWLLESNKTNAPRMWELTLGEYNKYRQNPDLFAQSRFTESSRKGQKKGFVDPELYGINSKYEYARTEKSFIKRPKTWATMDTIMIAGEDGVFETQKSWLQRVSALPNIEYSVLGSEDLKFKKSEGGDIYVYKIWEETKPLETFAQGEWKKSTPSA